MALSLSVDWDEQVRKEVETTSHHPSLRKKTNKNWVKYPTQFFLTLRELQVSVVLWHGKMLWRQLRFRKDPVAYLAALETQLLT